VGAVSIQMGVAAYATLQAGTVAPPETVLVAALVDILVAGSGQGSIAPTIAYVLYGLV
jgi:hypothetical protein